MTAGPAGCPWAPGGAGGAAVLAPRTADELAAVLAEAARSGTAVVPAGSGSQLREVPDGWVVWTRGLDRIVDHQPDDLTITVQAGATLAAVQQQLAGARQHVPHRPALAGRATIGGLLASHRPGLTRLGHGPLRDRVLGMTVALSSGELAASGGRVVKNVAGYDLHRLHVGAHGTLGVIAQVTLKVSPLPAGRTLLVAPLADAASAARFATALVRTPLMPVAVLASAHLAGSGPGGVSLEGPLLWVAFEDVRAGRDRAARDADALAKRHGLPGFARHEDAELPAELADLTAGEAARAAVELAGATRRGAAHALLGALAGPAVVDLGEGLVRCGFASIALSRALTDRVHAAGGWCAVTRAPAAAWSELARARPAHPAQQRMLAIRRALDPAGIMNPGRLLEGLL